MFVKKVEHGTEQVGRKFERASQEPCIKLNNSVRAIPFPDHSEFFTKNQALLVLGADFRVKEAQKWTEQGQIQRSSSCSTWRIVSMICSFYERMVTEFTEVVYFCSFFSRVISILGNFLIAIFLNGAYCVMTYVSFCLKSSFSCLKSCFWRIVSQKAWILTQNILDYGSNRSNKAAYYVIVFINLNADTILWKLTAKRSYSSVLRTDKNFIML